MTIPVLYEVRDNIALITLNSAPVNALGLDVRKGIFEGFKRATADAAVEAIILASSRRMFCGGADISEFSNPDLAIAAPNLPEIITRLECSEKLVLQPLMVWRWAAVWS
jgi:3-hydroxyacyl-CoA dehydrogenase